jgi:hypothetical protein
MTLSRRQFLKNSLVGIVTSGFVSTLIQGCSSNSNNYSDELLWTEKYEGNVVTLRKRNPKNMNPYFVDDVPFKNHSFVCYEMVVSKEDGELIKTIYKIQGNPVGKNSELGNVEFVPTPLYCSEVRRLGTTDFMGERVVRYGELERQFVRNASDDIVSELPPTRYVVDTRNRKIIGDRDYMTWDTDMGRVARVWIALAATEIQKDKDFYTLMEDRHKQSVDIMKSGSYAPIEDSLKALIK